MNAPVAIVCRKCGKPDTVSHHQAVVNQTIQCNVCVAAYRKEYRQRRKAAGNPIGRSKERAKEYEAERKKNPAVLARRAADMARYAKDRRCVRSMRPDGRYAVPLQPAGLFVSPVKSAKRNPPTATTTTTASLWTFAGCVRPITASITPAAREKPRDRPSHDEGHRAPLHGSNYDAMRPHSRCRRWDEHHDGPGSRHL